MKFMTNEWAEAYTSAWNNDDLITKKLKRFSSVFKYSINDREDIMPLVIKIEKGVCTSYGSVDDFTKKEIEYSISADEQDWKKVFDEKTGTKEVMDIDGFDFKGPKLKALSNRSGLIRGVELMAEMQGVVLS
jgi:putative sterol carrier protein